MKAMVFAGTTSQQPLRVFPRRRDASRRPSECFWGLGAVGKDLAGEPWSLESVIKMHGE